MSTRRYLCVYLGSSDVDWRAYTSINSNIIYQKFLFFVKSSSPVPPTPTHRVIVDTEFVSNILGPAGEVGATGPQGERGIEGQEGPAGAIGSTGPTGATGDPGVPEDLTVDDVIEELSVQDMLEELASI